MQVSIVLVMSLDGRLTRGDDPNVHAWTSPEDWKNFLALRRQHDVLVMQRGTYETIKPEPDPKLLRIIMATHPELYKDKTVKNQLEFVRPNPAAIAKDLAKRGYEHVLISGDTNITYDFLSAKLVDDIYVTIEPLMFGAGTPFMSGPRELNVHAQLKSVKQLNDKGTLLLHYAIKR
jgi:dihydrofolate reductase